MIKTYFLRLVTNTLIEHPDWWADTIKAMDHGLHIALENEREKVADMAYGFAYLVDQNPSFVEKQKLPLQKGLRALYEFFDGASIAITIKKYLEDDNANDHK